MSFRNTRRLTGACCLTIGLAACAHAPKPLYTWNEFARFQYDTLRREGLSASEQIAKMVADMSVAEGKGLQLPPGFRAHLGLLYLSQGDARSAAQMLQAESRAFPESAPYMEQLLKRMDPPATADAKGNAA